MSDVQPIVRQAGEGERLWFAGGGLFTMKATSAETGGAFFLFVDDLVRGKLTPYHLHPGEDETIYVLEGELVVRFEDGQDQRVGEGGFFFAPRGAAHAFMVTSDTARILCFQTPGSGEPFYRAVTEPAASEDDASRPPDFARLQAEAATSPSIEILGPPPWAPVPAAVAG